MPPLPHHRSEEEVERFKALNAKFRGSLRTYFARRGGGETGVYNIDDMVQEVFERLLKRRPMDDVVNLDGYVFETASSVLADRRRWGRSRHHADHEQFDEVVHGDEDFSPERVLLGKEALARVTAIMMELPERTRTILVLKRLEGMKYVDIARRLGISVSAVEKHMQRAMTYVDRRLEERE